MASPPDIHSTQRWGAGGVGLLAAVRSGPPKYIVIHHTTTDNVGDFSVSQAHRLARSIRTAHIGQGWADTGQQFTISRGGYMLEGRAGSLAAAIAGEMVVGTHTQGMNDYAVGIECEGDYTGELPPKPLLKSLVEMCAWLCVQYDLDPRKAIVPHRKFNATECCGRRFARTIPDLQVAVAKAIKERARG